MPNSRFFNELRITSMSTIAVKPRMDRSLKRIANAPTLTRPATNFEIALPHFASSEAFEQQRRKRQGWIAHTFFLLFITMTMAIGWSHPWHSQDILLYTGAALSLGESNAVAIHHQTYALAAKNLPPEEFIKMTTNAPEVTNREFYADIFNNPQHFIEQFPTVKFKILYVLLLFTLMKVGIDPIHGCVLISCVSWGLIALLVQKWLRTYLRRGIAEVVAASLLLLSGILDYAGDMGPDALSALVVVAVFYSIFLRKIPWITLGLLMVAMLIRLDFVLLIFLYLPYAKFIAEKKISWESAFSAALITLAVLFGVEKWAGLYTWNVHFYHCFIQRLADPVNFKGSVSLLQYCSAVFFSLRMKPPCNVNWFFIALAISGMLIAKPGSLGKNVLFHLTVMSGIAFMVHCLAFPEPGPRFFLGYYLIAGIFFIDEVRRVKASAWRKKSITRGRFAPAH